MSLLIPKVFHKIWLGPNPIHNNHFELAQGLATLHPGWEVKWWMDSDVFALANQKEFDNTSSWAGKTNILRYEILLRDGGIYLDNDFYALKNIEPLLEGVECLLSDYAPGLLSNAILGCVAGHPFFESVVRTLPGWNLTNKSIPGPFQAGSNLIQANKVTLYPEINQIAPVNFFPIPVENASSIDTAQINSDTFPESYAVHLWEHSWKNE